MTTASVALVHGDLAGAVAANPFVLGLALLVGMAPVLLSTRRLGVLGPPAQWSPARRRRIGWAVGLLAVVSWVYQLHRFGFI